MLHWRKPDLMQLRKYRALSCHFTTMPTTNEKTGKLLHAVAQSACNKLAGERIISQGRAPVQEETGSPNEIAI